MLRRITWPGVVGAVSPALLAAVFATVLAATLATGPAAGQSLSGAAAEDLRDRLGAIERELGDIRARLGLPRGGDGSGTSGGRAVGDVIVRLDRLEEEIRELTGTVERIEFEQRRIAEEAARRFGDIEFRLTELEGGDTSSLTPVPPLGSAEQGGTEEAQAVSVSERNDLDRAVEDVRQGRYDLAEDRLRTFLTTYPGSPLEGEARYWLGESQFTRGAFQSAARSYLAGYRSEQTGPVAARNLYRLGVTLGRLGQVNEACLTLREVRQRFPQAPEEVLEQAGEEADALACG